MIQYQIPWPIAGTAIVGFLTVVLCIELVVAMARFAVRDDRDGGE
jgi:hypothetical protein